MGRQIRRVPIDFHLSHPIGETWPGFLNPHYSHSTACTACEGSGYSPEAARMNREWYGKDGADFDPRSTGSEPFTPNHPLILSMALRNMGMPVDRLNAIREVRAIEQPETESEEEPYLPNSIVRETRRLAAHFNRSWSHHLSQADVDALVAAGRLMDFTRRPRTPEQADVLAAQATPENPNPYWLDSPNGYTPTAAEVNEWSLRGFGHDSINAYVCIRARCEREGVPTACPVCAGSGEIWDDHAHPISLYPYPDPAVYLSSRVAAEDWTPVNPPIGPAYQLWETVSEGSPITPAFELPEQLAAHLATFDVWGSCETDYETWLRFIRGPGWAPSLVFSPGTGVVSGVEFIANHETAERK